LVLHGFYENGANAWIVRLLPMKLKSDRDEDLSRAVTKWLG